MRIFVYLMTHSDDPSEDGQWGCCDCMGQKRGWNYDAVIGIGGLGAHKHVFCGKVKWVGITPHKNRAPSKSGPNVTFEFFHDFETDGLIVREVAPKLAARVKKSRRGFMNLTVKQQEEAEGILENAKHAAHSPLVSKGREVRGASRSKGFCPPKTAQGC
jgi:hypothetical protein